MVRVQEVRRSELLTRRVAAIAAAPLAIAAALMLFAYHPPRLVISEGGPIDVSGDITATVGGRPLARPTGRYLLLTIEARQPNLVGLLRAAIRGDPTLPRQRVHLSAADEESAARFGRRQ